MGGEGREGKGRGGGLVPRDVTAARLQRTSKILSLGTQMKRRPPLLTCGALTQYTCHAACPDTSTLCSLLINYYPVKAGRASKPFANEGRREPFIFPFWSGRLMPECELMTTLPQIVRKASELGRSLGENTFKLDDRHLAGCEPLIAALIIVETTPYDLFSHPQIYSCPLRSLPRVTRPRSRTMPTIASPHLAHPLTSA